MPGASYPSRVSTPTLPTAAFEPLLEAPVSAGVFTDFDGTLSEIVEEPDDARPLAGMAEVLTDLAGVYGRVGVLSGRPVEFLQRFFPDSVLLAGLYGLETLHEGVRTDHPLGGSWREVIDDVASVAMARGPAGMKVEAKGLSLTLHYRARPRLAPRVRAFAEQQASRSGLECRPARMSYELHPPIPADKGSALVELTEGLDAVCFIGDDVGDLRAFEALDKFAEQGKYAVRVAVHSSEEVDELIDRADVVVDDPAGVLELMEYLRDHAKRA
jgi:trehalose 6-phosphate phosphatase